MRRSLVIAGTAFAAAVVSAAPALAQGSGVMTHGSCATGLGQAGVASPCADGSAVLFSPAALAMQGSVASAGVTGITTSGRFTYDITGDRIERDSKTTPVPFGYASMRLGKRAAVGIGAFAPYGLGVEWPLSFEGRYVSYNTDLKNIYIQPTLAYRLGDHLSLGVGVDFVRGSLEINQRADLATVGVPGKPITFGNLGVPSGTDFADARLKGTGNAVTFNASAIIKLTDRADLGVRYMHEAKVDLSGDAVFTQISTGLVLPAGNPLGAPAGTPIDALVAGQFAAGGALTNQALSTSLTLPKQFVVGLAFRPVPSLKLVGDYQFTGWQAFDSAQIAFKSGGPSSTLILDYQNTNTYRFGADWSATDALNLRGGFIFNTAAERAASVSPLLPEAERNYLSAGLGYKMGPLALDLGYQHIHQADRRGRTRGRTSISQTPAAANVGVYHVNAHLLNATLSYHFGGQH
ncbi:MAG: long-chain fatty acid transport protein [Gemmatimonadetes bacterium]|nr:long-chain fatty acid transport protein [Gemmatimonadota bacterium]